VPAARDRRYRLTTWLLDPPCDAESRSTGHRRITRAVPGPTRGGEDISTSSQTLALSAVDERCRRRALKSVPHLCLVRDRALDPWIHRMTRLRSAGRRPIRGACGESQVVETIPSTTLRSADTPVTKLVPDTLHAVRCIAIPKLNGGERGHHASDTPYKHSPDTDHFSRIVSRKHATFTHVREFHRWPRAKQNRSKRSLSPRLSAARNAHGGRSSYELQITISSGKDMATYWFWSR
jgi:hypothetical protein